MSNREISIELSGGAFWLVIDSGSGSIRSNLHYESTEEFLKAGGEESGDPLSDQFTFGRYSGAVDALESLILAAANAGMDVSGDQFTAALQTTLDAIGHHL